MVHFGLHSSKEATQKKLFTEELHFAELSTEAEHLKVWILHGN